MKRNEDLLPSEAICRELALLCNRVTSALEALMIDPTPGTPGIEDVKVVGSFKKGLFLFFLKKLEKFFFLFFRYLIEW